MTPSDSDRLLLTYDPGFSTNEGNMIVEHTTQQETPGLPAVPAAVKPVPPPRVFTGLAYEQLKRLKFRCEQTIDDIVAEMKKRKNVTVEETKDGPLVHFNGGSNVLGVCHMDYVKVPHKFKIAYNERRVYTPRLDDRLGLFILLDLLPSVDIQLDLLFTDSEEKGATTAQYFKLDKHQYNWMVEFDRRGDGAVLYQYKHCKPWEDRLKGGGFDLQMGSFSDISALSQLGVCGVNVGVGYHHEHSTECYMQLEELLNNMNLFHRFYTEEKDIKHAFDIECLPQWERRNSTPRASRQTYTPSTSYLGRYDHCGSYDHGYQGYRDGSTMGTRYLPSTGGHGLTIMWDRKCVCCESHGIILMLGICERCILKDDERAKLQAQLRKDGYPYLCEYVDTCALKVMAHNEEIAKKPVVRKDASTGQKISSSILANEGTAVPWDALMLGDYVNVFGGQWVVRLRGTHNYRPITFGKKQSRQAVGYLHTILYYHNGTVAYAPFSKEHIHSYQDQETGFIGGAKNLNWERLPADGIKYRRVHSTRFEAMLNGEWYNLCWHKSVRGKALNFLRNATKEPKKKSPSESDGVPSPEDTQVINLDDVRAEIKRQDDAELAAAVTDAAELERAANEGYPVQMTETFGSPLPDVTVPAKTEEPVLDAVVFDQDTHGEVTGFEADAKDIDDDFPVVATVWFNNALGERHKLPIRVADESRKYEIITQLTHSLIENGCTNVSAHYNPRLKRTGV